MFSWANKVGPASGFITYLNNSAAYDAAFFFEPLWYFIDTQKDEPSNKVNKHEIKKDEPSYKVK